MVRKACHPTCCLPPAGEVFFAEINALVRSAATMKPRNEVFTIDGGGKSVGSPVPNGKGEVADPDFVARVYPQCLGCFVNSEYRLLRELISRRDLQR